MLVYISFSLSQEFSAAGQDRGPRRARVWPAGVEVAGASAAHRVNTLFYTGFGTSENRACLACKSRPAMTAVTAFLSVACY